MNLIGKNIPNDITIDDLNKMFKKVRIFTPKNMIGTANYLPDRANIILDNNNNITGFHLG